MRMLPPAAVYRMSSPHAPPRHPAHARRPIFQKSRSPRRSWRRLFNGTCCNAFAPHNSSSTSIPPLSTHSSPRHISPHLHSSTTDGVHLWTPFPTPCYRRWCRRATVWFGGVRRYALPFGHNWARRLTVLEPGMEPLPSTSRRSRDPPYHGFSPEYIPHLSGMAAVGSAYPQPSYDTSGPPHLPPNHFPIALLTSLSTKSHPRPNLRL